MLIQCPAGGAGVESDKKSGPGIDEVAEQKIASDSLEFRQGRCVGVGEEGLIVEDETNGQPSVELPVPLGAEQMIVEDASPLALLPSRRKL